MEFDYRADDDSGVMFFGDYEPGTDQSTTIEVGDEVTLKNNGNKVNVTVESINGDAYEGSVSRVIDDSVEFEDLEPGDEVEFFHSNIWARYRD